MVIHSSTDSSTGHKIYPFRGVITVKADSRSHACLTKKARVLVHARKKPVDLRWTSASRRANKKENVQVAGERKKKVTAIKIPRPFQGLSLEDFNSKKKKRVETQASINQSAEAKRRGIK